MKKSPLSRILNIRKVIALLDILLSILIIVTSRTISNTSLGKAGLLFGFIMLWITVTLRILHKL